MNPLERVCDIESRLQSGVIDADQALAELTAGPKPWTTGWWKEKRLETIGPQCATCGTSDPPLVLQHTWHPMPFREAVRKVGPPNWEWWKERHPIPKPDAPAAPPPIYRPVCPRCGSTRLYLAKKRNRWVCQAGAFGAPHFRHPDFEFAEPKMELRPDKKAIRRIKQDTTLHYQQQSASRWQAWLQSPEGIENRRLAVLLGIEESKRYLSFDDTKTLCRPCASREDYRHIRRSERRAELDRFARYVAELDAME